MKCPMKFNRPNPGGSDECIGRECAWFTFALVDNKTKVSGCCMSAWPLINYMEYTDSKVGVHYEKA